MSIDLDGNPRLVLDPHGLVAEAAAAPAAGRPRRDRPARLPVLVVDDSLTTRMLEHSILESAGYEVELAASGRGGPGEGARRAGTALFLVDIEMPGIDGFTFVAQTRADPVLARRAGDPGQLARRAEDRQRGREAGASAYMVKGEFDQEELLAHIRRLVGRAWP